MEIIEAIKTTYENLGIAVIDIQPIPGTPIFEMEFISPEGHFKRPVVTFFMIASNPNQGEVLPCQPPL